MSIKTSKRIALGVIASLVFAPFAAIAPANAAATVLGNISVADASVTGTLGTTIKVPVLVTTENAGPNPATVDDVITLTAAASATIKPAGATTPSLQNDIAHDGSSNVDVATEFSLRGAGASNALAAAVTGWPVTIVSNRVTATPGNSAAKLTNAALATLEFIPDRAGVYRFTVAPTVGGGAAAGKTLTTGTITVTVLPQTSLTSAITANANIPSDVAGVARTITVERNSAALTATSEAQILLQVVASAGAATGDALTVGTVFGNVPGTVTRVGTSTDSAKPVFTINTTGLNTGAHVFRAFVDTNSNGALDSGELTSDVTITVVAALLGTTKIPVTIQNSTRANVSGYQSFTVSVTANLPAGTVLNVAESAGDYTTIGDVGVVSTLSRVGTTNTYIGNFSVKNAPTTTDFHDVVITVSATNFTSGTADLRVVRVGDVEATFESIRVNDAVGIGSYDTDGVRQALSADGFAAATELTLDVDRTVVTQTYTITAASGMEGRYLLVDVARTPGTALSVIANSKSIVKIGADLEAIVTVTAVAPAASSATAASGYSLTVTGGNGELKSTVTYRTATPRFIVSPNAGIEAKYGDKVAVTASLGDQFGRVLADKDISVVVTGRSAGTYPAKTNSDGNYTFEWTDASTSTVILTDSVVFNYIYVASSTSTTTTTLSSTAFVVTYSETGIEVGSVTVNSPTTTTDRPIDQSQVVTPNASATVVYTATVKDATGAPVGEGALVTFTIGADDMTISALTQVTDEFGKASITVYRQKAGTATVSASAGGVASNPASAVKWVNKLRNTVSNTAVLTADYHARYVALTADVTSSTPEGVVRFTAKVTDRFGNPVEGVEVTFSETGAGRFYLPPTGNKADTNSLGEVSIDMITLKGETGTMNVTALITDTNSRQINDIAGFMSYTDADNTPNANTVNDAVVLAIAGLTAAVKSATATATVANPPAPVVPEVVVPPVAPTLTGSLNGRVLLFGACQADEGDLIVYVKSPGMQWQERAKTFECAAGEFDGSIRAPKSTKFYRVKQEGTGLWSSSVLIRR